jgi:hypothetical protein
MQRRGFGGPQHTGRQLIRLSALILLACAACEPRPSHYLDEGLNLLTQEEVRQRLGPPYEAHSLTDGGVTWHYHERRGRPSVGAHGTSAGSGAAGCGENILRFDHDGILREWNQVGEAVCDLPERDDH